MSECDLSRVEVLSEGSLILAIHPLSIIARCWDSGLVWIGRNACLKSPARHYSEAPPRVGDYTSKWLPVTPSYRPHAHELYDQQRGNYVHRS